MKETAKNALVIVPAMFLGSQLTHYLYEKRGDAGRSKVDSARPADRLPEGSMSLPGQGAADKAKL